MKVPTDAESPTLPLPSTRLSTELNSLAETLREKKLNQACAFLLEAHRPFANVFFHLALLTEPVITPLFRSTVSSRRFFSQLNELFSNQVTFDSFVALLVNDQRQNSANQIVK